MRVISPPYANGPEKVQDGMELLVPMGVGSLGSGTPQTNAEDREFKSHFRPISLFGIYYSSSSLVLPAFCKSRNSLI